MTAEIDGDCLTEEEIIANCIVTMVGGQETTTNLIGNGVLTLIRNPDETQRLRDDLSLVAPQPLLKKTEIDFDLNGRAVVLCDDVLYTGRTVRAALDGLIDLGRPRAVRLAVLIDRGHREIPIEANYVGKSVPTAAREVIKVMFEETDGADEVWILEKPA